MAAVVTKSGLGPVVRPKKVLAMGFFRTGSVSLARALQILGYDKVFHFTMLDGDEAVIMDFGTRCWDATMSSLPSYNGEGFTRTDYE
jgi:hypothetical protein